MDTTDLRKRLCQAGNSSRFQSQAQMITDELQNEGRGLEAVDVILRFIEENPTLDFGPPGPLLHYIEKFYRRGYEAQLLASLGRRPTVPTISLLNRLVNGTNESMERGRLIQALRSTETHPLSQIDVKRLAAQYLERLDADKPF